MVNRTGAVAQCSVFEALFLRSLPRSGQLDAALRREGFDPEKLEVEYPVEVWIACVRAAARTLHPDVPLEIGLHRLGRVFPEGWFQTLVGRLAQAIVAMVAPGSLLMRFPRLARAGRTDFILEASLDGDHAGILKVTDPAGFEPHFLAGVLERSLELTGVKVTTRVDRPSPQVGHIHVSW